MATAGDPFLVVTLDPGIQEEVILEGPGFKICAGPFRPRSRDQWMDGFAQERGWVRRILERERPRLVHAHWTYEYALGTLDSGLPHLITAHDAPWAILNHQLRQNPRGLPYRIVRTVMAYQSLRRVQHLTAVSRHVAQHLQRFRFTQRPIAVIPNGLPDHWFRQNPNPRPAHPATTFVAIFSGGFSGNKNGPNLLRAFQRLQAQGAGARLILYGAGSGPGEEGEDYARRLNCIQGVSFRGHVPHDEILQCLVEEADALVHPAFEESFGMPLMEAMAQGLPVIAGCSSGGVGEIVKDGCTGLLVDVRSPDALAQAMANLHRKPAQRIQLGLQAQQHARTAYHINTILGRYRELYQVILNEADSVGTNRRPI